MATASFNPPKSRFGIGWVYDPTYGLLWNQEGQYYDPSQVTSYQTSEGGDTAMLKRGAVPFSPTAETRRVQGAPEGYYSIERAAYSKSPLDAPAEETRLKAYEDRGWLKLAPTLLPQLGFQGQVTRHVSGMGEAGEGSGYSYNELTPEAQSFVDNLKQQGYQIVADQNKILSGRDYTTRLGLADPSGRILTNWEESEGSVLSNLAPMISAFAFPLYSIGSGIASGAMGAGAGGAGAGAGGALTGMELAGGSADLIPGVMGSGQFSAAGGLAAPAATAAPAVGAAAPALTGTGTPAGALASGAQAAGAVAGAAAPAAGPTGIELVDKALNLINTPAGQAVLGAAGSAVGGIMEASAAEKAAETQSQAAQNALQLQREMFEYQKGLLEPYRTAGTKALERLSGAMGLGGPGSQQQMLEMDPGYGFRLGEGLKALERMQASRGNFLSGGALKAGQRFAQDTASQEYGNAYNRLANIAGLGQTVGGQLGNAAAGFGTSAGNIMGQEANALAAGRAARGSAYSNAIGGALGAFENYLNRQQRQQVIDIYGRKLAGGG